MKLLNKVKFILLTIFFMALIFTGKCFATTGVITEITVNLRKEPSTNSKKIMYVTQDDKVEVIEKVGDWYKIRYKGVTGYVFSKYIKVDDSKLEDVSKENKSEESTIQENTTKVEQTEKVEDTKNEIQDITTDVPAQLQIKENTSVRLIPNITSNIIYTSKKVLSIEVIEQLNEWSYISVDSIAGWVRTDKIVEKNIVSSEKEKETEEKTSNSNNTEIEISYIKYDTVNLRKKASINSTVLAKLKLNDEVSVLEKIDSKWSKVKVDGLIGYISTDLLSDKKQEVKEVKEEQSNTTSRDSEATSRNEEVKVNKEETTTTKKEETKTELKQETTTTKKEENKETITLKVTGADIVAYAKKYLGYDYVYGGSSPKTGFDCSGFTYYVYKHFGYTLSRSSTAQANNGTKVSKKDLQPGDLVIYKNASLTKIGHVGIYIGNNKMIHASEPGVGVVITDIDSKAHKYPQRYVTARRIIK